ncbi:MAG: preprotein translocase subunit YajC [Oligoflexus sp.]
MLELLSSTAYAQTGQAPGGPSFFEMFALPIAFLVIMYLLVLRPQHKKHKEHQELLKNLKAGDEVVTTGGIIGRVRSVAEGFVTIDAGGNTQLKIQKHHVSALTSKEKKVSTATAPKKA